jgi:Tol biopolymer transport system component
MHRLTNGPGPELSPSWSPDGKRLVYRYTPNPNQFELSGIWKMNADGSGKTNLTRDRQGNWGATWSPDGKHILFNSGRDGSSPQLYLMNPDGTGLRHLLTGMWGEYPDWSPDGKKIAFMSNIGTDSFVLYVMNADGSGITRVSNGPTASCSKIEPCYLSKARDSHNRETSQAHLER